MFLCFVVYLYRVKDFIALLNNCPVHGKFPSDAWLKMNTRDENIFIGKEN